MAHGERFDWDEWYDRFSLGPATLVEVTSLFPEILVARQSRELCVDRGVPPVSVTLSDEVISALLSATGPGTDLQTCFERYLEQGEIAAATLLTNLEDLLKDNAQLALQRAVGQRQQALELQYAQLRARANQQRQALVNLGLMVNDDDTVSRVLSSAELLFRHRRLGKATEDLERLTTELEIRLQKCRGDLLLELEHVRTQASAIVRDGKCGPLWAELNRLVVQSEQSLSANQLLRAERSVRQGRVLLETRNLAAIRDDENDGAEVVLRGPFPNVRTRDILAYVESGDEGGNRDLRSFVSEWCPEDWRQGPRPDYVKSNVLFNALRDLNHLSHPETRPPDARGAPSRSDNTWHFFLMNFFELLGKRDLMPARFEELHVRSVKHDKRGYYLGRCSPDLTVRYSFLDPRRFQQGLATILWHKPNAPLCPKPVNLQNELSNRGLENVPLLFVSPEPVLPEDRDDLHRNIPNAALLDEMDLLQVMFCSDRAEERALHFARAIAWQLSADAASPYVEQGEVTGTMFVGRREVLSEFLNPQGPTILYGGRKLGKSSIFRQLEREFEAQSRPNSPNIAIYVNAISIVDDVGIEGTLLPQIVDILNQRLTASAEAGGGKRLNVYRPVDGHMRCDGFANHIRTVLKELARHRFLLLIDEADSLLQFLDTPNDSAIRASKRFGWTLRGLVQESGGRFDVRFAGFQEINRAAQSPSGPFYNFRSGKADFALSVLTPTEGRELIVRPLQVLGAVFEDDSLVDLILDFTGQHPALVQDFCQRLYKHLRGNRRSPSFTVTQEDVESIWRDAQFRKSVIRAIHLNVETRQTKPEMILRLLLYLWVRQIVNPHAGHVEPPANPEAPQRELPVLCEATDLYQLLCAEFGTQSVEQQVKLAELDNYLSDLATLGVLEKHPQMGGYVFRYRYFASLLYRDHFRGQMSANLILELWQSIQQHRDEPPRMEIKAGNELSISPFTRHDQARLEQEGQRVSLVLGAPGTGKTEFFKWLEATRRLQSDPSQGVDVIGCGNLTWHMLRDRLAEAFSLSRLPTSWRDFYDRTAEQWRHPSEERLVVLDDVDQLASLEGSPILLWPDLDQTDDDGLLFMLAKLMRESEGRLRVALTGSFGLARLWVDYAGSLTDVAAAVTTTRLEQRECDAWAETAKISATRDIRKRIFELTAGDWRLLTALRSWLRACQIEAPSETNMQEFEQLLLTHEMTKFPELKYSIERFDPQVRVTLRAMAALVDDSSWEPALEEALWCDLLTEHFSSLGSRLARRSRREWQIELRAAALLRELVTPSDADTSNCLVLAAPVHDRWFRFLTGYDG